LVQERHLMTDPTPFSTPSESNTGTSQPHSETHTAVLDPPAPTGSSAANNRAQLWMHRISVFLFVLISAVAGVLLIILPWTPEWTDNNYLLLTYPNLRTVLANGFVRGVCSGLGLLDIWIGFWEALHYHEHQ
jgi:hypothetical protein